MKNFWFDEILIVSDLEQKARRLTLGRGANALVGTNHTGKSTILRSIYLAFGCKTRPLGNEWRRETVIVVRFHLLSLAYTIMRDGNAFSLFNGAGEVLWVTTDQGVLRDRLAELFDFPLPLTSKSISEGDPNRQARPAFFFIPFFIDQDGSWDSRWGTFQALGEFKQWEAPTLDLALGIRPAEYWKTSAELTAIQGALQEINREEKVLLDAKGRLEQNFPVATFYHDAIKFRSELKALLKTGSDLASEQDMLRTELADQAALKQSLETQLRLVEVALADHGADMVYLDTQEVGREIPCPTCGTLHENSFHERLNLEAEADELRQLRASLKKRLEREVEKYAKAEVRLSALEVKGHEIEKLLNAERGKLKLREIVDRAGIERAHKAFEGQHEELTKQKTEILKQIARLEVQRAELDNKIRAKEIRSFFNAKYSEFAVELAVPASLRTRKGALTNRPQQGGSGGPRAVLAYYFALSKTAERFSNAVLPPLVIDSPHQKAQDEINRPMVTEFILRHRAEGRQLLLGLEEDVPPSVVLGPQDRKFQLSVPYGLLNADEYEGGAAALKPLLSAARNYLLAAKERAD